MKGTYVLVVSISDSKNILIGKKNTLFKKGFYMYVGSALNSLEKRIGRHLSKEKRFHWHIDYLLEHASIEYYVYAESGKMECSISKYLSGLFPGINEFGCSDCSCRSHLYFTEKGSELKKIFQAFEKNGLNPVRS